MGTTSSWGSGQPSPLPGRMAGRDRWPSACPARTSCLALSWEGPDTADGSQLSTFGGPSTVRGLAETLGWPWKAGPIMRTGDSVKALGLKPGGLPRSRSALKLLLFPREQARPPPNSARS